MYLVIGTDKRGKMGGKQMTKQILTKKRTFYNSLYEIMATLL